MGLLGDMSLFEIAGRITIALAGLSVIIQITPIKISPWTWIAKKIGRAVNSEVIAEVDGLKRDVFNMKNEMEEQFAKGTRVKILRFGDEILHGQKHSREHFDEVLQSITDYRNYCNEHPEFLNQMTEATTKIILETYETCARDHTFL